jgi:hypothetical protein
MEFLAFTMKSQKDFEDGREVTNPKHQAHVKQKEVSTLVFGISRLPWDLE